MKTEQYLYVAYSYGYEKNLKEVCDLLTSLNIAHKHYNKGETYSDNVLLQSSGVVLILSDYKWEYALEDLTRGIKTEVCKALSHKIPIYIAYKRQSNDMLGIYKAIITSDSHSDFVA